MQHRLNTTLLHKLLDRRKEHVLKILQEQSTMHEPPPKSRQQTLTKTKLARNPDQTWCGAPPRTPPAPAPPAAPPQPPRAPPAHRRPRPRLPRPRPRLPRPRPRFPRPRFPRPHPRSPRRRRRLRRRPRRADPCRAAALPPWHRPEPCPCPPIRGRRRRRACGVSAR